MSDKSSAKSLADPALLEMIDKLLKHDIADYVSLPQLLVVGDQSSGKSSVLEGVTGLPFPRDSGLCSKFATHITLKRAATTGISVSIIPTASAQLEHKEKLKRYHQTLDTLDKATFEKIIEQVCELMGVKGSAPSDQSLDTFSDDVLKIEICGPNQQHLSVIDVPGIFRNTEQGKTTDADIKIVRNMVNNYMKNPRSIILAVVPANVDIATQEILKMAGKFDKEGQRTLGVLTKPDLVDRGAENRVVDLVEGRSSRLKLGWSLVKNPGQSDLETPTFDRHASEKEFFKSKEPWAGLQKTRVGVESLQAQLRDILTEMVKKEFPNVKSDINRRLYERKKELESLGPCRENREQQQEYLLDLATRFQKITDRALAAHYAADDLFDLIPSLKLATVVVHRNKIFADDVWKRGHTMSFSQSSEQSEDDDDRVKEIEVVAEDNDAEDSDDQSGNVRQLGHEPDLGDILHDNSQVPAPKRTGIIPWLHNVYNNSRGFELGDFDPSLICSMLKKQAASWDDLALGYVSDIVSLVHDFILSLISSLCRDQRVQSALMSVLMDGLMERYKKSMEHTKFILYVEKIGTPLTENHYFAEDLEKYRQQRMQALKEKEKSNVRWYWPMVKRDITLQSSAASNTDHTIRDLHDILKSYYKVARKRFVDVVCMQAVDHHLITGPAAPVKLFSSAFVIGLKEDQLERIAGEDVSTKRKREELRREIENLTNGKKILI